MCGWEKMPTFRRNILHPSSWSKSKSSKKQERRRQQIQLGLLFDPENAGKIFHQNIGLFLNDTACRKYPLHCHSCENLKVNILKSNKTEADL
jgi:hypothetical protein